MGHFKSITKGKKMFTELFKNFSTFAASHQILITGLIAFGLICLTWGIEKILETYLFPKKPIFGYLIAILGGIALLWTLKHVILKAI
jgi:hypothetical protein